MNNKGFTLIELLAVITIITMIAVVAVPSALVFQNNMRKKMYCSKVDIIERGAKMYGEDVIETIKGEKVLESKCNKIGVSLDSCQFVTINSLLAKGYLKKEKNNTVSESEGTAVIYDEFYDPRNYRSMKRDYVIVYIENNRAYARYVYENLSDLEYCNKDEVERKRANPSKIFGLFYKDGGLIRTW